MRVLWVFGPPAVGKSKTAWAAMQLLAESEPCTAFVDIDQLGMLYPRPVGDTDSHRLKGVALAAVAAEHRRHGITTLVVAGVLDPALEGWYRQRLATFEVAFVRLSVSTAVLRRRMRSRGRDNDVWDDLLAEWHVYERVAGHPAVQAGQGSPVEVAADVLAAASFERSGSAAGADMTRTPVRPVAPRGVVVGGTIGVGKSTVAWHAYQSILARGSTCSFIDLRQVALVGAIGDGGRHELQAGAAAALCNVHIDHGADWLLLNGRLNTESEFDQVRSALPGLALSARRLVADHHTLTERIRAHARSRSPDLEGDPIRGLDDVSVRTVAARAFAIQTTVSPSMAVPTIDTSQLSAAEGGAAVLAAGADAC